MARSRLVAGNWKMHGSRASIAALLDELVKANPPGCAVCPPFPFLAQVADRLRGTRIAWGAQNASEHAQGAYTGEVSAAMLAEFGCRYVIVGHSERRHIYGESDAQVAAILNVSQDHLDFHRSMADYWEAKSRLFHWPGLAHAVVNVDDDQGMVLDRERLLVFDPFGSYVRDLDLPLGAMPHTIAIDRDTLLAADSTTVAADGI